MLRDVVLLGDELSLLRAIHGDGGCWAIPDDPVFRESFQALLAQDLIEAVTNRYRITSRGRYVLAKSSDIAEGHPVAFPRVGLDT